MANADCIVIQGSNMAECHPVGFQWVTEAKARGAKVIHIDPRFTRTSPQADKHIPIRVGSDIALLGGLINYVIEHDLWFKEYVLAYTNAATLVNEDFRDTEDLEGLFSGYDPETGKYDPTTWAYRDPKENDSVEKPGGGHQEDASHTETAGAGGPALEHGEVMRDETLTDPHCVFQLLKKHYARYTPEMVSRICGISEDDFLWLAQSITANSGRERTTLWCYAVGWTHHTDGVQMIRTGGILQLLLGNVGRPGSGIMALRGHASIQGSTDIPTLYNLLPGYLPMPSAGKQDSLEQYIASIAGKEQKGFWADADAYTISLLKAWWGEAATPENDFAYDYLPKLTGPHGTYQTVMSMLRDEVAGYFVFGQNPAVGSAHSSMQRMGLSHLKWLVVRDLQMIETATFWQDSPEVLNGELRTEEIGTEVFLMPAANHVEKAGSFTQTQRMLQWRHKAVNPPGDARSELEFFYELGLKIRERLADSADPRDRPLLDLTWDYPVDDEGEIIPESVLREINGVGADGKAISSFGELRTDGSTTSGCWIYAGVYADEINHAADRVPGHEQDEIAAKWGWAWPANRRILYNRASADPQGRPWSERKKLIWWDEEQGRWTGKDVPDFPLNTPPGYRAPAGVGGGDGLDGDDPFIMQADGKGWLFAPKGVVDGPLPTHYEPQESPVENPLHPNQQSSPTREVFSRNDNIYAPPAGEAGADVYPYVFTTYRLTEHHTAGGMSRWLPYLSELQPEMFCEISKELAQERGLEHYGWATIISPRAAIEVRVFVTDRVQPLQINGRTVQQIGLPYHWGVGDKAVVTGDSANDLLSVVLDPNVQIQEAKAGSCDIRPGRRPRGAAVLELVREYQRRAGGTVDTGIDLTAPGDVPSGAPVVDEPGDDPGYPVTGPAGHRLVVEPQDRREDAAAEQRMADERARNESEDGA
ncbi:molybdopterin-dependent oxidoreductase [Yimella sp. cx-51]|nr:molybdopterin-dependent oxidoreductase [Yimella sp. cx-51]